MRLSVPTNWRDGLIEQVAKPAVDVVYGKLSRDFAGGGRPSCVLKEISKPKAKKHIELIHQKDLKFYYLLNSSCMGNLEFTKTGQKSLVKLLDWITDIKADGVVVAIPYLAQFITNRYPNFKISVSCFANVNSIERAKFWEDLGTSVITLSHVELIRDFRLLERIRKTIKCELQLIVNDNCIQGCPVFFYHNNVTSHSSQTVCKPGIFMFDYCRLMCRYNRITNPINFIRGTWIRPEDIKIYEDIGIDRFKLVDRTMHTEAISVIVDAYSERSYKGNLYDLFISPSKSLWLERPNLFHKLKYFFHPFAVNIFKMIKNRKLVKDIEVYIDNTKLDGFINHFLNEDCRYKSCEDCGFCQEIAEKVVRINPEYRQRAGNDYSNFLNEIISGEIFKY